MKNLSGTQEDAEEDLALYSKLMASGNVSACIQIEKRWGLYGYPPSFVSSVLARVADGESLDKAIELVEG